MYTLRIKRQSITHSYCLQYENNLGILFSLCLVFQSWSGEQKQNLVKNLAELFLQSKFTEDVCKICRSVILDVVVRAADFVKSQEDQVKFYVAVSKGITLCPDLKRYVHAVSCEFYIINNEVTFLLSSRAI